MITFWSLLAVAAFLYAQDADLDKEILNQEVGELEKQANYERAVLAAKRAIEMAEANVGQSHPYVAISLSNLALLYKNHGEYAKATPLYKRSVAIWEIALGPEHPYVAHCLSNLSELYQAMGKDKEALEIDKKIERIKAIKP